MALGIKCLAAIAFAAVCLMAQPALAAGECDNPPPTVLAYLQAHPEWKMHTLADIGEDSKDSTWAKYQGNRCPGWLRADLDGKGVVYAVIMSMPPGYGKTRIVIVGRPGWENLLQLPPHNANRYLALTLMPPDKYKDLSTGKFITLAHDAVGVVMWERGATGYYLANGKLKSFTASD